MKASELISAKLRGVSFDRICEAVESNREKVSTLPEDQAEFLVTMLAEVKKAVPQFEQAVLSDKTDEIKETAASLREIFSMIEASCETRGETD